MASEFLTTKDEYPMDEVRDVQICLDESGPVLFLFHDGEGFTLPNFSLSRLTVTLQNE